MNLDSDSTRLTGGSCVGQGEARAPLPEFWKLM